MQGLETLKFPALKERWERGYFIMMCEDIKKQKEMDRRDSLLRTDERTRRKDIMTK